MRTGFDRFSGSRRNGRGRTVGLGIGGSIICNKKGSTEQVWVVINNNAPLFLETSQCDFSSFLLRTPSLFLHLIITPSFCGSICTQVSGLPLASFLSAFARNFFLQVTISASLA